MNITKRIIGVQVKVNYAWKAIKAINQPHLGDVVLYKGHRHELIQGVSNPYWDLLNLSSENMDKPVRDIERHVHVSQFKLQPLRKRFRFSFMFTYKFLMGYWFQIEVNRRLSKLKAA